MDAVSRYSSPAYRNSCTVVTPKPQTCGSNHNNQFTLASDRPLNSSERDRLGQMTRIAKPRARIGEPLRLLERVLAAERSDECVIWPFNSNSKGYARCSGLPPKWKGNANRYICTRIHGQQPSPNHEVAHSCGKGHLGCINPGHVSWKTSAANKEDKIEHGTFGLRLRPEEAVAIKLAKGRVSAKTLASDYGVCFGTIYEIWRGEKWGAVT